MGRGKEIWIAASALSVVLAAQAQAEEATRSGVAAVARGATTQRGQENLPLRVGDPVFANQRIQTGPKGRALIVLADRTTLAVGPNSDITIENYAFDAEKGTGEMVMSAARGVFRFVGGLLSKANPVRIKVPTGTIGVRGAVAMFNVNPLPPALQAAVNTVVSGVSPEQRTAVQTALFDAVRSGNTEDLKAALSAAGGSPDAAEGGVRTVTQALNVLSGGNPATFEGLLVAGGSQPPGGDQGSSSSAPQTNTQADSAARDSQTGGTQVVLLYGQEVTHTSPGGETTTIDQPGTFMETGPGGETTTGAVDTQTLATLSNQIEGGAPPQGTGSPGGAGTPGGTAGSGLPGLPQGGLDTGTDEQVTSLTDSEPTDPNLAQQNVETVINTPQDTFQETQQQIIEQQMEMMQGMDMDDMMDMGSGGIPNG